MMELLLEKLKKILGVLLIAILLLKTGLNAQSLTEKDKTRIKYEAKEFILELEGLMNMIAMPGLNKYDRDVIKENSYTSSGNQIFLDDKVIIEDDIDPKNYKFNSKIKDLNVARYLNDLDLFYSKTEKKTIVFSNIKSSEVRKKDYIYLEVYFESRFKGKHITINEPYKPTKRVATIIAKKEGRNWNMLIGSIVHYNPSKHAFVTGKETPIVISKQEPRENPSKVKVVSRKEIEPQNEVQRIRERVFSLGANLGYGFVFNQASIGANAQVYLADYLASDLMFNYFASQKIDGVSEKRWSIDTNLSYVFEIDGADKIPYMLVGLNFLRFNRTEEIPNPDFEDDDDNEDGDNPRTITESDINAFVGFNIGAGMEFISQKNMVYFGQVKYTTGEQNHFLLTVGFRFKFKTK